MNSICKISRALTTFILLVILGAGHDARSASAHNPRATGKALHAALIDYYPLMSFRNAQPEGLIFEYVHGILSSADLPLQYSGVSINRAVEMLRATQVDVVVSLYKTKERGKFIRYSQKPLLALSDGVCTLSPLRQKTLTTQSRLGFVQGTIVPQELRYMVQSAVSGENSQLRMLQMLEKGRVDAIHSPMPAVMILAAHHAGLNLKQYCYELKGQRRPVYLAFSKLVSKDVVRKIDEALQKKVQAEDFDTFMKRRFIESGIQNPGIEVIDVAQLHGSSPP
jgi:ABC-type amino acid transport substrate-binding protein